MRTICEEPWRRRMSSSRLREVMTFEGESLVLGCDTRLWKPPTDPAVVTLRTDVAHDRLIALLAVAGRGRLAKATVLQLDAALDDWCRGQRALAAIRLAFIRAPRVRDLDEAHALFLAETALDAGLSPNDLLKELGYAACVPLLKDYRTQPRVPANSGRESGRWTSDTPGVSFAPGPTQAALKPSGDTYRTMKPIPVFLPQEGGDAEEHDIQDKARHLLDDNVQVRIRQGHTLPQAPPGGFAVAPAPEPPSLAPYLGLDDPGAPHAAPVPSPIPIPLPGGSGPSTGNQPRNDKGPACPKQENDVANGPSESGDNEEYLLSLLINPESPTPKNSTWTPNVQSKAYFLPSPAPKSRTSFDDCKQRDTPTTLPIPGLRPGDMFEIKAGGWGWELWVEDSAAFEQFKSQVDNQNAAVVAEGQGRQIYYCVPSQTKAEKAANLFAYLTNSHFLVCH